jgi:isoleucyl-tRNA synthetase
VSPEHPLIPDREVDPRRELPAMELEVLERWRERDVFAASIAAREGAPRWGFYEGPPTANGPPGSHHVLARVFKDIYPRFHTMRGYRVERKGGWDCHGLPVEIAVEQQLGIKSKAEIEEYGIARFNERCRESVFMFLAEWDRLTERIGFWIDLEHAYRTLDESYIESVWWALSEIHARGLLYEGRKVVPYCPRCETTLSSHEVALGYRDVVDPSVYLKLKVAGGEERLLVWTTTPWTLPGNVALAVSPSASYVTVADGEERYVLAEERVAAVLGEDAQVQERFSGRELIERFAGYEGPIFDLGPPRAYPVLADDFVTTDDGTGIVHLAPAFGEDDYRVAAEAGIFDPSRPDTLLNPVRPDGTFDERVRARGGAPYAGRYVKDEEVTQELIDELDREGMLLRAEEYEHSYPHCWRSENPLIYYAKPSWYIATSQLRDELLASNETVHWYPPHVKEGRFGDWLRNNVDWALSRERYWGTPLPVWRCGNGHVHLISSFDELAERSGEELSDHHRPFVDGVTFPCTEAGCEEPMRRVPEVIDVWFDSGSMPFAQNHYPFEHADTFESAYPADFICEAQDQTRGWFYSLLAIATLLGKPAPYRNVVCLGLILDEQGQKMSKSRGNAVEPSEVLDRFGADAFRWYFFTSKAPWDGYRFSVETIGEGVRLFLKQLWSTYYFYALYARAAASELADAPAQAAPADDLDRWAISRTAATAELVAERLEDYDATTAGRAIAELVDELSNWYVRRSRRRFWEGDTAAFQTLRTCLLATAKMLAPFCPFIADEIYDNLDGELASVHLCDFPVPDQIGPRDRELEAAMELARETVRLGLGARGKAKIKIRQPLGEAVVVAAGPEREAIERLAEVVREELNVSRLRFVAEALRDGETVGISISGREHPLSADDVILTLRPPEGYAVEREGTHAVALDLEIDEALREAGRGREVVHAVQNARKNAGLAVEDRIELDLDGDPVLVEAASANREYLSEETLAVAARIGAEDGAAPERAPYSERATIEDQSLAIGITRA